MEADLLTAVTAKAAAPGKEAVVAPAPSLTNRLSVGDFQRLPAQEDGWQSVGLPQVVAMPCLHPTLPPGGGPPGGVHIAVSWTHRGALLLGRSLGGGPGHLRYQEEWLTDDTCRRSTPPAWPASTK